ncbi:hypothetical protein ACFO25_03885 [Paenactinomyces guangxiensis]|uniref:Uncharacterized protein n=1 Tax=Paenactinomyces guangxiensis TaxID=1490290 RepID=A0A7W1WRU3_9BACL|nr:hypothetical protein [Paenactinomyces guangxiensis]MBA4494907.1 hypothetical protein [Paenactinomyces guangxiensis]MBH8591990.1 hypothetical protein [Paenactinomyces guangxiensis]
MEMIAFFLLTLFIAIVIIVNAFYRSAKKSNRNRLYVLTDLGIQNHSESFKKDMCTLISHLEASLPEHYTEQVKERVIREHKISLTEWENRWFEWKRYLVMIALLKSVPMFSRDVDDVWHEMLMFTREYDEFSRKFLKTKLHHVPNAPDQPFNPHERAWFDIVYTLLFKPTKYSISVWGSFLKHPLSQELVNDLENGSFDQLSSKYLNQHAHTEVPASARLGRFIVQYLKSQIAEIHGYVYKHGTSVSKFRHHQSTKKSETDLALWMLNGVLFLSVFHPDHFAEQYQSLFRGSVVQSGGSSPSGCSSCGSGDNGGSDSGGSDGGGGSSCGGGSCGGGGCGGGGCGGGS